MFDLDTFKDVKILGEKRISGCVVERYNVWICVLLFKPQLPGRERAQTAQDRVVQPTVCETRTGEPKYLDAGRREGMDHGVCDPGSKRSAHRSLLPQRIEATWTTQ